MEHGFYIKPRSLRHSKSCSRGLDYIGLVDELIRLANHSDGFYNGEFVPRGTLSVSCVQLAQSLRMKRTKLNNMLTTLVNDGFIIKKSDNRKTTITICEYDSLQAINDLNVTANGQLDDNEKTASGQLNGSQLSAINQQVDSIKRINELKDIYIVAPAGCQKLITQKIAEYWKMWIESRALAFGQITSHQARAAFEFLIRQPENVREKTLLSAAQGGWKNLQDVRTKADMVEPDKCRESSSSDQLEAQADVFSKLKQGEDNG